MNGADGGGVLGIAHHDLEIDLAYKIVDAERLDPRLCQRGDCARQEPIRDRVRVFATIQTPCRFGASKMSASYPLTHSMKGSWNCSGKASRRPAKISTCGGSARRLDRMIVSACAGSNALRTRRWMPAWRRLLAHVGVDRLHALSNM